MTKLMRLTDRFRYSSALSDEITYKSNRIISKLIRGSRIVEARNLFDQSPLRNVVTWNSMISGYLRIGDVHSARELFDKMSQKDVVTWNLMIFGYAAGYGPQDLEEGRRFFDMMPQRDSVSWNTMINGYMRKGKLTEAVKLFDEMPNRNIISWNSMISGFLQKGYVDSARAMFDRMTFRDSASLSVLVSGLIQNDKLDEAAEFLFKAASIFKDVNPLDAFNTLIAGYGQRARIKDARAIFDHIPDKAKLAEDFLRIGAGRNASMFHKNVVSWNTMIMCYVKVGDIFSARKLFDMMQERDLVSWNTMINAYVQAGNIHDASRLFVNMPHRDTRSWNSMISGYAQNGEVGRARSLFDKLRQKSLVSWNSMIAAYEQNGDCEAAVELFLQMRRAGEKPDRHTLSSVLCACGGLACHYQGMQIHQWVMKIFDADIPLINSLITMYAKCGNIRDAKLVFDEMKTQRDFVSWNALIGGFSHHGCANEALELFREMKRLKIHPTHITFLSILTACGHSGLVDEGRRHFDSMVSEFGVEPGVEHFASLVDTMGRPGNLRDALELIKGMPVEPNGAVWGALLAACRVHNDVDTANTAAQELMRLEPESSAPYVLLHNMYVEMGQWNNAVELRRKMERKQIRKQQGYSQIELHCRIYQFVAGDYSHPDIEKILASLKTWDNVIRHLECLQLIESIMMCT